MIALPSARWRSQAMPSALTLLALVTVALAFAALLLSSSPGTGDYMSRGPIEADNAGPVVSALAHGQLARMPARQPVMGLTSIILRAPLAALAGLAGGGNKLAYGLGALACLLPVAYLGAWLIAREGASVAQRLAGALAAVIVLGSPATIQALHVGHPEELLVVGLATGGVLAATRGRHGLAAVLLGLAIGTKQWALLMVPCVLLALPDRKLATAVKAGVLGLSLTAVLPIADPAAFRRANTLVGGFHFTNPFSVWWPWNSTYAPSSHRTAAPVAHLLPLGLNRSVASGIAIFLAFGAVWVYGRRAGARLDRVDALALLALVGLVRCVADPDPLDYYFVALLIPLATWEAVALGRPPLLAALATGAIALLPTGQVAFLAGRGLHVAPGLITCLWLAWTLPLGCYLAHRSLFRASRARFELRVSLLRQTIRRP